MSVDLNEMVGAAVMAEALDIKKTRINELVQNGVLHPTGSPRKYPFLRSLHDYIAYLRGRIDPTKDDERTYGAKKLKADMVYKTAKAQAAQLELAELEGNMHRSTDVAEAFEQLVYTVRSMLVALPGRLAMDVAAAQSPAETSEIINAQVMEMLSSLEGFSYDPDFFAERVRDRRGWQDGAEPGDEGRQS